MVFEIWSYGGDEGTEESTAGGNAQKCDASDPRCYSKTYTRRVPLRKVAGISKDHCSSKLGVQDASPGVSST
jgi:hypothetical protein